MSLVRSTTDDTVEVSMTFPRTESGVLGSHRRVVMTTCQAHGSAGFTNLLVTKENGIIVLNPHVANCCVLRLDEQAARALLGILDEWLG
jgi:hypothetical protein